eukprot:gene29726-35891_t
MKFDNESIETSSTLAHIAEIKAFHFSHCLKGNENFVEGFLTKAFNLEEISLTNSVAISDTTILVIAAHCKHLKHLNLSRARSVSNNAVIQLSLSCPNLMSISLRQCFGLRGDAALLSIILNCKHMTSFDLYYSETATDNAILAIADHCGPNLTKLILSGVSVLHNQESILHLLASCPNILTLSLSGCRNTILTCETINSIAENCKLITSLDISDTRMLDDACIDNLARNCVNITNLDISGLSLTIRSIYSIVRGLVSLRTIKFYQYNENLDTQREGNDLHDAAFRVLAEHFEAFTALNLCDCVVSGVPRVRDAARREGFLPAGKSMKVSNADIAERCEECGVDKEVVASEECSQQSEDLSFLEGAGCYGEDEDFQPGSLTTATVTGALAQKCTDLVEFRISSQCSVADCMAVIEACDGSKLTLLGVFMLDLQNEHVLAIAAKCRSLTTLKFEHMKSVAAASVCALIAANPGLVDVTIRDCHLLEDAVTPRTPNWFVEPSMLFGGHASLKGGSSGRIGRVLSKRKASAGEDIAASSESSAAPAAAGAVLAAESQEAAGGNPPAHVQEEGGFEFNFQIDSAGDAAGGASASTSALPSWPNVHPAPSMNDEPPESANGIDRCVLALARSCSQLQSLDVSGTKSITDFSLTALARGCPRLVSINVGRERPNLISQSTLAAFIRHCPALREVVGRFEPSTDSLAGTARKYNVD